MAALSRGKRALQASLKTQAAVKEFSKRKGSSRDQAKYWCQAGLDQEGFEKKFISSFIGNGVFTTKQFSRGDFLLEYAGERINSEEAEKREQSYRRKQRKETYNRCYMYTFKFNQKLQWIDATKTTGHICHFVNDADEDSELCNAKMKMEVFDGYPRLCLYSKRDIALGEEIRYDYGDLSDNMFWRAKKADLSSQKKEYKTDNEDDDLFDTKKESRTTQQQVLDTRMVDSQPTLSSEGIRVEPEQECVPYNNCDEEMETHCTEQQQVLDTRMVDFRLTLSSEGILVEPEQECVPYNNFDEEMETHCTEQQQVLDTRMVDSRPTLSSEGIRVEPEQECVTYNNCDEEMETHCTEQQQVLDTRMVDSRPTLSSKGIRVQVQGVQKKECGNRIYDKVLACLYCGKLLKHRIVEHLNAKHCNETEVAKALAKSGKLRAHAIENIKHMGNYKHNIKVINLQNGNLIVAKRSATDQNYDQYLPCIYCLGFF